MEIKQNNNEKNGYFEAFIDDELAGKMSYTWQEPINLLLIVLK